MTSSKTDVKNTARGLCCCKDCKWGDLLQYGNNPLLAECRMKPQPGIERFPYQREVARAKRTCAMFEYEDGAGKTVRRLANTTGVMVYDRKDGIAA